MGECFWYAGAQCTCGEHPRTSLRPVTPSQPTGHPSPALAAKWRAEAEDDADRRQTTVAEHAACTTSALRLLAALDELARLGAENERQRELLRRVACYAVVDPMGNPIPHAAHMFGIELDIRDYLAGRPPWRGFRRGREG